MFEVKFMSDTDADSRSTVASLLIASSSFVAERLTNLTTGGECAHKQFTTALLSSLGDSLQFEALHFGETAMHNTVALQMTPVGDK
jgi:hypothetical protein